MGGTVFVWKFPFSEACLEGSFAVVSTLVAETLMGTERGSANRRDCTRIQWCGCLNWVELTMQRIDQARSSNKRQKHQKAHRT